MKIIDQFQAIRQSIDENGVNNDRLLLRAKQFGVGVLGIGTAIFGLSILNNANTFKPRGEDACFTSVTIEDDATIRTEPFVPSKHEEPNTLANTTDRITLTSTTGEPIKVRVEHGTNNGDWYWFDGSDFLKPESDEILPSVDKVSLLQPNPFKSGRAVTINEQRVSPGKSVDCTPNSEQK